MSRDAKSARRPILIALALVVALACGVVVIARWTQPVRSTVAAYTRLLGAANRQDLAAARSLCSGRYLKTHALTAASEGGIIGLPRNIHTNFQAWRKDGNVWICPTNRVGPVYQFVFEDGAWRFDGPVGLLRGRGEFVALPDAVVEGGEGRPSTPPDP